MDFEQCITAHVNWKSKLKAYIAKPDHSLTSTDVAQDNRCDLGKWLVGEGAKLHGSLPEFQILRSEHARFHKAAAEVVRHADAGQNASEEVALGGKSDFSTASTAVVSAIVALKAKVPVMSHR